MVKRLVIFLSILLPFCAIAQDGLLNAYVDRTEVSRNDVFTLTLRVNSELSSSRPDINILQQNFEIISSSERNSFTFINGASEQWSEFIIELRPRFTGTASIPSFRVGNEFTIPITITVAEAIQSPINTDDFFLSSTVSKENIYVQEQLLYTVKIYFSQPFDQGAQLETPEAQDAVIQQLGNDINSQEVIGGLRYSVIERHFVIFPQSSGSLRVSPINFTATVGRRRTGSIFSGQMTGGRAINLISDAHLITVQSKPADYPTDATWLPSSNLIIEENWSSSLQGLETGEAITRNLRLRAEGLHSSLLPDIEYTETEKLKFYPDQPSREDLTNQYGVIGIRSQSTAIVATEGGVFILPSLEIPWWNTLTNSLQYATLAEQTLSVLPGITAIIEQTSELGADKTGQLENTQLISSQQNDTSFYWVVVTAIFAVAWLYSTLMWYLSKLALKQFTAGIISPSAENKRNILSNKNIKIINVNTAFHAFQKACKKRILPEIRQTLLSWSRLYFTNNEIITLAKLRQHIESTEIQTLLNELEYSLYSSESDKKMIQTELLLKEIKKLNTQEFSPKSKVAEH